MKDWVTEFVRKSKYDDPMIDNPLTFWLEDGAGFFTIECRSKAMVVMTASGNGKRLDEEICRLAQHLGYKKIIFETRRNPKAWERLLGYKQTGYILEKELTDG